MSDSSRRGIDHRFALALGVFFASGATGLVYQVVWSRMLTLVIGVSIFAITTVLTTFMAGLGLGSYAMGRWATRWRDPLRVYGVVEGLIGIYALFTPWLFEAIQPLYVGMFPEANRVVLDTFRVLLSGLVLLAPTALMGGTLPLLSQAIAGGESRPARGVGLLYAVNTFGAVAGCVAAGFWLLADLGIRSSLLLGGVVNLGIAAAAIVGSRVASPAATAAGNAAVQTPERNPEGRFILTVFFFSGFAALAYEVLWTRALLVYVHSSTYAFTLMLTVYLLGVAAGSMAVSPAASRSERPLLGLAICQLGVAAGVVGSLLVFPHLESFAFALVGANRIDSFGRAVALMFSQSALVLLAPTIFMGAMLPLGVAAYLRPSRGVGRGVGSLYAMNTLGNIAGSVVAGFALIPWLGVRHSLLLMLAINLLLAAAILGRLASGRVWKWALPVAAAAAALSIHFSVSEQIFFQSIARGRGQRVIFYREGAADTVAVIEKLRPEHSRTLIYSDGRGAAGTNSLVWNLYFGHLPMLLHPDPQDILHICFGSGNSTMALTRHDPRRIDVVELSPHVRDAAPLFWTNERVLDDPRVHLIIEDGRNFLLRVHRKYDVVSLEPPQTHSAGVVNLYTQEFYELARDHLKPGGIMMQWLPAPPTEEARGHLIRAFTEAFPNVTVWQQLWSPVILLVGTMEPLAIDVDAIERRLESKALRRDLDVMGTKTAEDILSYFLLGDESVRRLVKDFEPVRDDRTIVDYTIPREAGSGFGFIFRYPFKRDSTFADLMRDYASWRDPMTLIIPDPAQAERVERAREARDQAIRDAVEHQRRSGSARHRRPGKAKRFGAT
jgi:spermidine synthase